MTDFPRIEFYSPRDSYGGFSNFSRHLVPFSIQVEGQYWPTSEHCYQGLKYYPHNPERMELIRNAATPRIAADLGRDRNYPIRADWEEAPSSEWLDKLPPDRSDVFDYQLRHQRVEPLFNRTKDCVMYAVVQSKVLYNLNLQLELLNTRGQALVEASPKDSYWGIGADRQGYNKLGRILMKIRAGLLRRLARSEG